MRKLQINLCIYKSVYINIIYQEDHFIPFTTFFSKKYFQTIKNECKIR